MRILIADDHPLYREALRAQVVRLFPGAQVDELNSFEEVAEVNRGANPAYDLFLIDFHMPGMSIPALKELAASSPSVPVAVISGTANAADVRAVIGAGARGFIPKTATSAHLVPALQLLLAGGTSVPANFLLADSEASDATDAGTEAPWLDLLTSRELDVLKSVARGLSNKEVGRELGLAEVTVKLHLRSVFRKVGARSRSEAAVIAAKAKLA